MDLKALSTIEVCIYNYSKYEINKFLSISSNNKPLLFYKNSNSIKSDFCINYNYSKIDMGLFLLDFLNLDLSKFNDFFRFFCTFIVEYISDIPEKDRKKILSDLNINTKYLKTEEPKHIVDVEILKKYAKKYFTDKTEIEFLQEVQKLFRNSIDYVFNNKETKIPNLNTFQKFYILQNSNKDIKELSEKYKCDYKLNFNIHNSNFMYDLLYNIADGNENSLSNEDFLINNILKNDPNGEDIYGGGHTFETNDIFTYFYIIFYYITLNKNFYIKKCNLCNKYFLAKKENTLFCNNKYTDDMTCKEYGIKTSQKRKENEEPVYGKYRQIYAKKAMMVKRNPDIPSYKVNYEKWKKEAKQFMQDIKDEIKSYEEFDKWLDIQDKLKGGVKNGR